VRRCGFPASRQLLASVRSHFLLDLHTLDESASGIVRQFHRHDMFSHKKLYIDTNALKSLKFETEIAALLNASKEGKLLIFISECVIWERARQYYESQKGRLIPVSAPLVKTFYWFMKVFADNNIKVINITEKYVEETANLIKSSIAYFQEGNINDHRDAMIFSMATSILNPEDSIILCEDKRLITEFERFGFEVREDSRNFIRELFGDFTAQTISLPDIMEITSEEQQTAISLPLRSLLEKSDPAYSKLLESELRNLPPKRDKLSSRLSDMRRIDEEIRIRVLGYSQWFSPISKAELHRLLENQSYNANLIENNAQRLCVEELLRDIGNHFLPNDKSHEAKEICEQAMTAVMDEILRLIGLS
jgi:hypothetical protein